MKTETRWAFVALVAGAAAVSALPAAAQNADAKMSFFVTSVGSGKGANLGGLEGADRHCQDLASAVGAGNKTWHAYLSATAADGKPAVDARDRIGSGPWYNVKGVEVAKSVDDLHSENNKLNKQNSLTEKGTVVNGVGDRPNQHDILTGSTTEGRLQAPMPIPAPPNAPAGTPPSPAPENMTCNNWTSSEGSSARAMLGHLDRMGGGAAGTSWNSAHASRGCSQEQLVQSGGAGLFYCFAVN
jgi:hypothetical protein